MGAKGAFLGTDKKANNGWGAEGALTWRCHCPVPAAALSLLGPVFVLSCPCSSLSCPALPLPCPVLPLPYPYPLPSPCPPHYHSRYQLSWPMACGNRNLFFFYLIYFFKFLIKVYFDPLTKCQTSEEKYRFGGRSVSQNCKIWMHYDTQMKIVFHSFKSYDEFPTLTYVKSDIFQDTRCMERVWLLWVHYLMFFHYRAFYMTSFA